MSVVSSEVARACIVTLGCAKNEVDSAHMKERLLESGYEVVEDPQGADAIIVNTCSFIQAATEESLQTIFELAGLESVQHGDAHIVVAGCMPARYGEDLSQELNEASSFVPCSKEDDIALVLDHLLGTRAKKAPISSTTGPLSTYVKISDGCNRFCSFCTIPYIRGRYHSFSQEQIADEVQKRIEQGAHEIVLIAQDTGRYGDDFDEPTTLAQLMANLAEAHPHAWFRVMYLQPEGVTDELLEVMAAHSNIASYLDIPFQHANERILRAMNRRGDRDSYLKLIEHIRATIPDITLRTTLIAGFPGETDEDFEELCDFIEAADLDYVGVFAYSQEEGTRAAKLSDQVDDETKQQRAQILRDLADSVSQTRIASRIGSTMDVLVLGVEEDGQIYGRSQCQAPDVDGVVYLKAGTPGTIQSVTITDTFLYEMEGE